MADVRGATGWCVEPTTDTLMDIEVGGCGGRQGNISACAPMVTCPACFRSDHYSLLWQGILQIDDELWKRFLPPFLVPLKPAADHGIAFACRFCLPTPV